MDESLILADIQTEAGIAFVSWKDDLVGVGCSMNKVRESTAHTLAPADQPANPAVNVSAAQARHSPIKKLRTKSSLGGFILARLFGQIEVV
jgi:hypothetical protein